MTVRPQSELEQMSVGQIVFKAGQPELARIATALEQIMAILARREARDKEKDLRRP